jgi:hypothetical protein
LLVTIQLRDIIFTTLAPLRLLNRAGFAQRTVKTRLGLLPEIQIFIDMLVTVLLTLLIRLA